MATGFTVAFAHAALPTHWLPFVLAGRGQGWSRGKTLLVSALAGSGHVLFTTALGVVVVGLGIAVDRWTGEVFPYIAGSVLVLFGLYYLVRQVRGVHGHSHFGSPGHVHDLGHAQVRNTHHDVEFRQIDTGRGVLTLEVLEEGMPPHFRLRARSLTEKFSGAEQAIVETVRSDGSRQLFALSSRGGFLESVEPIPEPHIFTAHLAFGHGDHAHGCGGASSEAGPEARTVHRHGSHAVARGNAPSRRSDPAVILSLLALLTLSPCEGFLPVYLSGIAYGWSGFVLLSLVLGAATLTGMMLFTWLALAGMERLNLEALEKYESGTLGGVLCLLGVLMIVFE